MQTTKLNFDFTAHCERCNHQTHQAIHGKSYAEQLKYYHEQIAQSQLAQLWQSFQSKG